MGLILDGSNNKIYNVDTIVVTDNTGEERNLTLNSYSTGSSKTLSFDGNRTNKGYKFIITTGGSHPNTIFTRTNSSTSPSDYLDTKSPTRQTIGGTEYEIWTLDGGLYSFGFPVDSSKMFYFKNGKTYFYFYYEGLSGSGAHGTYGFNAQLVTFSKLESYENKCEIKNNLICNDITATGNVSITGDLNLSSGTVVVMQPREITFVESDERYLKATLNLPTPFIFIENLKLVAYGVGGSNETVRMESIAQSYIISIGVTVEIPFTGYGSAHIYYKNGVLIIEAPKSHFKSIGSVTHGKVKTMCIL